MAKKQKIFVLDTSVLLHDHQAITTFEDNNVAIPITVLEELDKFKVGNDTKNFCAREVIRFIDRLSGSGGLQDWITLGKGKGNFRVIMEQKPKKLDAENIYAEGKNDHKIINAAQNENDHRTNFFLEWFVHEQIEEEDLFESILQKFDVIGRDKLAIHEIDKILEKEKKTKEGR